MENNVRMPMRTISDIIWKWLRENFNDAKQLSSFEDSLEEWTILTGVYQEYMILEKLPHGYILYMYAKISPYNKRNIMKITEPFKAEAIGNADARVRELVKRLNSEYKKCTVLYNIIDPAGPIKEYHGLKEGELNMNIKKIMYNTVKGITTVIFDDGTHVMTKCSGIYGEKFDPEIGLAMCIAKKYYGSRNKFEKVVTAAMDESKEYNEKRLRKMMKKADAEGKSFKMNKEED